MPWEPDDFPDYSDGLQSPEYPLTGAHKTVASWSDLLGFGETLRQGGWNLQGNTLKLLKKRLIHFYSQLHAFGAANEEVLTINDGVIRTFNPNIYNRRFGSRWDVIHWITSTLKTHCLVTGTEQDYKLPGIRTFICEGETLSLHDTELFNLSKRINSTLHPFSTQLNTALSKCFAADTAGSRAGFRKGGAYIEDQVVDTLVGKFGAVRRDNMIILFGRTFLEPVSKYTETKSHHQIGLPRGADPWFDRDRTCWFTLGERISFEIKGLTCNLFEIVEFSPDDESSLFYFDAFRGNAHGFSELGAVRLDEDGNELDKIIRWESELPEILLEHRTSFERWLSEEKTGGEAASDTPVEQRHSGEQGEIHYRSEGGEFLPLPRTGFPEKGRILTPAELNRYIKVETTGNPVGKDRRYYDHIDLRVPDLTVVEDFYRTLLPALGFEREQDIEGWLQFEDEDASQFFGVTESPGHRPNENRIAFQAGSVEAVEHLAKIARQAGAINIEGPMRYAEDYYAVFFEDPCGNRFEICHRC